jgi:arsenate reductase (thioredoxin)
VNKLIKILFVCVENAGRSQMAEAFAKKYGENKFLSSIARKKPADEVNPLFVEAMKEKGIDISQNKPKLIFFQMTNESDLIVTMGGNDQGFVRDSSLNQQSNGNSKTLKESP